MGKSNGTMHDASNGLNSDSNSTKQEANKMTEVKIKSTDVLLNNGTGYWHEVNTLPNDATVLKNTKDYLLYVSENVASVYSNDIDDSYDNGLYIKSNVVYGAKNGCKRVGYSSEASLLNKVQAMVEDEELPEDKLVYGDDKDKAKVTDCRLTYGDLIQIALAKDLGKGRTSNPNAQKEYRIVCNEAESIKVKEYLASVRNVKPDDVIVMKPSEFIDYRKTQKEATKKLSLPNGDKVNGNGASK